MQFIEIKTTVDGAVALVIIRCGLRVCGGCSGYNEKLIDRNVVDTIPLATDGEKIKEKSDPFVGWKLNVKIPMGAILTTENRRDETMPGVAVSTNGNSVVAYFFYSFFSPVNSTFGDISYKIHIKSIQRENGEANKKLVINHIFDVQSND